jgi:hypothetical protein
MVGIIGALMVLTSLGHAQTKATLASAPHKETRMPETAQGTFDVKVTPVPEDIGDPSLGHFTLEKQFHGDLEAASKGQRLTAGTAVKGSRAYVAIEKVIGTLRGRTGTFVLRPTGTRTQGEPQMLVTKVPDSGTGELVGDQRKNEHPHRQRKALLRLDVCVVDTQPLTLAVYLSPNPLG